MKRVIVMGATSGIGREIALLYLRRGYIVGIAGRREERLEEIRQLYPKVVYAKVVDVTKVDACNALGELIGEMGGVDIYVHCSGYGRQNVSLSSDININTVMTNVLGFTCFIDYMYNHFKRGGTGGHIVNISSIAGTKGLGVASTYSASKRYQWTYLEALYQLSNMDKSDISFTDIRPGFVDTDFLANGNYPLLLDKHFVAQAIITAVDKRKHVVVIDWKYRILCFFWRLIPSAMWRKLKIKN